MPLSISVQCLPPSAVRNRCGRMSSSHMELIAAYATFGSKWLASSENTRHHGFNCGGVTLSQCEPPSRVTQIRPSSVPAQIKFSFSGEGASAYTTPRWLGLASLLLAYLPTLAGTFHVLRVRSGLICFQFVPPSSLCHTLFDVKYR